MPLQRWEHDEADCKSFRQIVKSLRSKLMKKLVSRRARDRRFLLQRDIKAVLVDCSHGKDQIKELCTLTEKGRRTLAPSIIRSSLDEASLTLATDDPDAKTSVSSAHDSPVESVLEAILDGRQKMFTILLFCNVTINSEAWHNFYQRIRFCSATDAERFGDDLLPLTREQVDKLFGYNEFDEFDDFIDFNDYIYRKQSLICVQTIHRGKNVVLGERAHVMTMPYINEEPLRSCDGDDGEQVYKVEIAEGHFPGGPPFLVRKDIGIKSPEVDIWERLVTNPVRSSHIIEVEAIIYFPDKITILMERAEGDVQDLLSNRGDLNRTIFSDKLCIARQFLGIVKGGMFLHESIETPLQRMTCAHLDIRPQSVVRVKSSFQGEDTYKLIDHGMYQISAGSMEDVEFDVPSQGRECSNRAPECDDDICFASRPKITCACDMWPVGTLLCSCAAWLWAGPPGYKELERLLRNEPFEASNLKENYSFYLVDHEKHLEDIKDPSSSKMLYVTLKTPRIPVNVAMRFNHKVEKYFQQIRDFPDVPDDENVFWLKSFIWRFFEILKEHCLVPNPKRRGTMRELYGALNALIAEFANDKSSR